MDDSDLEVNEARLDWLHTKGNDQHSDLVRAEVEKGFGLLTLELEVPYQRDVSAGTVSEGVGDIDLGARYPIYQFVSGNGSVDSTFGAGIEAGIPAKSSVSKNAELVPKIFDNLRLGDHFTLQSVFGYSTLFGGGAHGGLQTFEYGFVFGYTIQHEELPLSGVLQFIPVLELSGETQLNKADRGHHSLLGDIGFRANLKTIGRVQPRVGLAFVFPIDRGARDDLHWGVITSLVFEYRDRQMKRDDLEDATPGLNRRQFLILAAAVVTSAKTVDERNPTDARAEQVVDVGQISNYTSDGVYDAYRDLGFFVVRKRWKTGRPFLILYA